MIQLTLVAIQDIFVALSGTRMRFEIKKKRKGKKTPDYCFTFANPNFICGKIRTDAQFSSDVQCSSSCTTAKLIHKANTN